MEENKDYRAYRYGDHLEPGSELKIEHSIYCEDVDISSLITMGAENLESMRQGSIDGEQKAYEIVVAAAKQWEKQAAATQMINRALSYLRTPEVTHTANEWRKTDNWRNDEEISNRVYRMTCGIWEDTKYDRETKQGVPVAWYVTWDVYVNSPKQGYGEKIAGQNQKRYTDKAAAEKYLVQHCINTSEFCTRYFCQYCVVVNRRCHRIASFLRLVLTKISGTLFTDIYATLY